jgi:precorrin-6y C5,15-methyltransferase (decarboxylating) CbiE subunit
MADQLVIIGTGPGNMDMLTPEALRVIGQAELVIGSKRLLEIFAHPEQFCYELTADFEVLRVNITAWQGRKIAFLVSGDPGFYSILDWLKREFPATQYKVLPGISSMQLAFARLAQSWYDCKFISLHGRPSQDVVRETSNNQKVCILTDEKNHPASIVHQLQAAGIKNKWLFIGSALGTPLEQVWQGRITEYNETALNHSYSVVIVEDEYLAL